MTVRPACFTDLLPYRWGLIKNERGQERPRIDYLFDLYDAEWRKRGYHGTP